MFRMTKKSKERKSTVSATQVEVPITARYLVVPNKEDKQTQTEEIHSRCTLPDTIRPFLASLQALHDVSANNVSVVHKLCTDGHIEDAVSRQTAEKCLIEYRLVLVELFVLREIHGCVDLVLGLDGTSTYFGRAFNGILPTGRNVTQLIGLVGTVEKTALDMLNQFTLCWARVNDVEKRYGCTGQQRKQHACMVQTMAGIAQRCTGVRDVVYGIAPILQPHYPTIMVVHRALHHGTQTRPGGRRCH